MPLSEPATGFSLKEVARLLRLPSARVKALVRAEYVQPRRDRRGGFHFSFENLVMLRNARALMTVSVPRRRLQKAFSRLRQQVGDERLLPSVNLSAEGRHIVARRGGEAWEPESGQRLLSFDPPTQPAASPVTFHSRSENQLNPEPALEHARHLEEKDPEAALEAYATVLEGFPDHVETRLDIGRLLHELGDPKSAESHFRHAMEVCPEEPIAAYNLGVTLQDLGRTNEAIEAYRAAVDADSSCADAHYNLAAIFHDQGNEFGAMKHFKIYRRLSDS